MTVADAKLGSIIEILDGPAHARFASGRIFQVAGVSPATGRIKAYKRFRQGMILLHPSIPCRDVSDDIDAPSWRF